MEWEGGSCAWPDAKSARIASEKEVEEGGGGEGVLPARATCRHMPGHALFAHPAAPRENACVRVLADGTDGLPGWSARRTQTRSSCRSTARSPARASSSATSTSPPPPGRAQVPRHTVLNEPAAHGCDWRRSSPKEITRAGRRSPLFSWAHSPSVRAGIGLGSVGFGLRICSGACCDMLRVKTRLASCCAGASFLSAR